MVLDAEAKGESPGGVRQPSEDSREGAATLQCGGVGSSWHPPGLNLLEPRTWKVHLAPIGARNLHHFPKKILVSFLFSYYGK